MSYDIGEVKKILRSILVSVQSGMSVHELEKSFLEIEGRNIPYHEFGFSNVIEFLSSIPETLRLSTQYGQLCVLPVISEDDSHIMKLVLEQQSIFRHRSNRCSRPPANRTSWQSQSKPPSKYRNRPTNHVSKNVRPQTAYHSKNIIETPMVGRKKCNATSNPVKENTNTCGPVELIESDSSSESELTSTAVPTKISTNGIQLPKNSDNAKFAANIPKKSENGSAKISSSVYSRNNQNSSERIACVVSNTANFSRNNQQSDEENDALPQMTRYEFMTLLDDDEFITTNRDPFANLSLSQYSNGGEGSTIKILVPEVHSPYKFWFQLQHSVAELEQLMEALKFYDENILNAELHLPPHLIRPGQVCVALYGGQWHRARIVDVYEDETIKVFYLDYGTVEEVFADEIRLMRKDFAEMLPQAFRGCLDNIRPAAGLWTREASQNFKSAVQNIKIYAKVTGVDAEEKTYYLNLTDTTKEVDININDLLIDNGHALHEKVPMMQAKRRHYNERYPTFDMLENGEYPSFAEIGYFISHGYDFAIHQQSIIIPQMYGYSAVA